MAKKGSRNDGRTVVIRRIEETGGGHHGGAWKVAYADFVTAMMAFFLLMWLINATSEQQRRGIAAYFSPMANVENGFSGAGLVPGGVSPLDKGSRLVDKGTGAPPPPDPHASPQQQPPAAQGMALQSATDESGTDATTADTDQDDPHAPGAPDAAGTVGGRTGSGPGADAAAAAKQAASTAQAEQGQLQDAAERLRARVAADPSLAEIAGQMAIDVTPEGLRIQIMDSENRPMFDRGDAVLNPRARALLRTVAPFLATLPEPVSVGGHTDSAPLADNGRSNWTLSSARADAARDLLVESGLPDRRIAEVSGFADRRLLLPADPLSSANRRIVLTLHRLHPAPGARTGD